MYTPELDRLAELKILHDNNTDIHSQHAHRVPTKLSICLQSTQKSEEENRNDICWEFAGYTK